MPSEGSVLVTVETSAANASLARQFIAHAGLTDKISVIDGSVSGGELLEYLKTEASGEAEGATVAPFDLAFIDHDKTAYLMDLKYMLKESLVVKGSVLVADNILFPGAPDYRKFVKSQPEVFETTEHFGHVEHLPFIKDCITVSTML
jgi:catechol O-methyltransferase